MKIFFKKIDLIGIIFLIFLFSGIRETNDWEGYVYLFTNLENSPDVGFYIVSTIVKSLKGDIVFLSNFYYFSSLYLLYKIIKYYEVNFNFIILNLFIYTFFYHMNQIRYFLGLYLYIYCIINIYSNKRIKSIILGLLSLFFHKSIILLYLYLLIYNTKLKNYFKRLILSSILLYLLYRFLISIILKIRFFDHYKAYINRADVMTTQGWIFSLMPFLLYLILIIFLHLILKKNYDLEKDIKYQGLIKLSLFPIVLIFISKDTLDIILRYMIPLNVLSLIYFAYTLKYFKKLQKIFLICIVIFISFFNYFWTFELGIIFGKETQKYDHIKIYKKHIFNTIIKDMF
ncbi:MAG: EpsG family protein [Cetobacterium sp.]